MTYLVRQQRARAYQPMRGVGNFIEDWWNDVSGKPSGTAACLAEANATTATLDAKVNDLAKNWKPNGFYSPSQVQQLLTATLAVVRDAQSAVDKTSALSILAPDARSQLKQSTDDLTRAGSKSLDYTTAWKAANAQGAVAVNAPGLKTWITNTMNAASSAFVTAYVVSCEQPWWAGLVSAFFAACDALVRLAKSIVGVAVAVGSAIVAVASSAGQILTIAKWGALAAAGIYAAMKVSELRRRR